MRAGIGPRIARVHVGTGRTGLSSGMGPFSVYGAVGGKRRPKSGGRSSGRPSAAALERQAAAARRTQAAADKAREAQRLAIIFQEIISVHRHDFPPVERPVASMPELPDPNAVRQWHEKNALRGVGMFDRAGRAAARQAAAQVAQAELSDRWRQAQAAQAQAQHELDKQWALLTGNDPDTVLATLAEAFEDNEAPAAPVGIAGAELSLIVLVPGEDAVPERLPSTTQAGNLTLRKLPKGERSALYLLLIAGHVLVTLREAFAVAPGVDAARVIAVRRGGPDIYGHSGLDCMVAGRWTRAALNGVRWADADAGKILAGTATELVLNQKRGQVFPVDLSTEPEIRDLLSTMDTTDPEA
ncbi:MAG: hypothetical protein ACRDOI_18495 [Trebonia sp.]